MSTSTKVPATRFLYTTRSGKVVFLTAAQFNARTKSRKGNEPALAPGQCCHRAKVDESAGCAYAYAWTCPVHGNHRVGTSD